MSRLLRLALPLAFVACPSPYSRLEPPPGRYFHHAGASPCDTFTIDESGAVNGLCEGAGQIDSGLFEPPQLVCDGGIRYGLTPTLDGFALTRGGQVHIFVFPDRALCEQALPKAVEPTL